MRFPSHNKIRALATCHTSSSSEFSVELIGPPPPARVATSADSWPLGWDRRAPGGDGVSVSVTCRQATAPRVWLTLPPRHCSQNEKEKSLSPKLASRHTCAFALLLQSCLTLCSSVDCGHLLLQGIPLIKPSSREDPLSLKLRSCYGASSAAVWGAVWTKVSRQRWLSADRMSGEGGALRLQASPCRPRVHGCLKDPLGFPRSCGPHTQGGAGVSFQDLRRSRPGRVGPEAHG